MIPLKDDIPSKTFPFFNYLLIMANIIVFFLELAAGDNVRLLIYNFGLIPVRFSTDLLVFQGLAVSKPITLISYMFLHGGFWHLLGNVWFLYIFGDNVEDKLGHFRYLVFYLLCGVGAALCHMFQVPISQVPMVGASGAIAGVMGAYMILYPKARVLTLVPIFFFIQLIEIPAFFFLALWFFIQFSSGLLDSGTGGGIAWWGHVGGFISGVILILAMNKKDKRKSGIYY